MPARRRLLGMLVAQFGDGFGGRFHGVLLGVYVLRMGGLASFAGFAALGTLGGAVAPIVATVVTGRFGGRVLMRGAAVTLTLARVASYGVVLLGEGVWGLLALRLLGGVAGILLVNGAKGQVRPDRGAATSLAWLNAGNGAGQVAAGLGAGLLATASEPVIAVVAVPTVVAASIPMLRLARFAPAAEVSLRDQVASLRLVVRPAVFGAAVMSLVTGPLLLADGLTAQQYGAAWLGPLSAMGFLGGLGAASVLPMVSRLRLEPRHDPLLWAGLGAAGLSLWAFSDAGPWWLLAGRLLAGLCTAIVVSRIEARVLVVVPRDRAVPALAASAGMGALATAMTGWLAGPAVAAIGIRGLTLTTMLVLSLVGIAASLTARRQPWPVRAEATPG